MLESLDYQVNNHDEEGWSDVTILREPWKGIIIKYGALKFGEANDDGTLNTTFQYDIIDLAGHNIHKLESDRIFVNFLGDVLINILADYMELDAEVIEDEGEA